MSVNEILKQRQKTHGEFEEHANITQKLKRVIDYSNAILTDEQKEALEMIFHKIGRVLAGDPNHKDNWDDIAGYAMLVSKAIDRDEKNE